MSQFKRPDDHAKRIAQMEARAEWELGDSSWAAVLWTAYEYPDVDANNLRREMYSTDDQERDRAEERANQDIMRAEEPDPPFDTWAEARGER